MATVVLTVVGAIVGGPIGAAVGAIAGQQIDNAIFAPGRRQGPRLGDLSVQTSSYGSAIPKLFGTVRVSGTVIWATDLKETRTTRSNGKGRGSTDIYSYSSSFAVALSGRPIVSIGRIWADGKLLRGAGGDLKVETSFRTYSGTEGQTLDPLIAATEGLGTTPAYRGVAYAVFENMQLANYGNRIPSLSFEVIADIGGTSAGTVIANLGRIVSDGGPAVGGLAATGDSARGLAETIAQAIPFSTVVEGGVLKARFSPGPLKSIPTNDRGATAGQKSATLSTDRIAAAAIPDVVALAYNDTGRDYLVGTQRARRDSVSRRETRIDLPAALSASGAKALAEARLSRLWAERSRATVSLPWRALPIVPGDRVAVPGLSGVWRVARATFEAMVVRLDLVLERPGSAFAVVGDSGRNRAQLDLPHGPTSLQVLDLPQLSDTPETTAYVAVAANGATGGWRRASLMTSIDGGATYADAGTTAFPAVIGQTVTPFVGGEATLIDRINTVEVQLIHAGLTLNDADDAMLLAGANLAMIGAEAIQFGRATPLGAGRWQLTDLWRGRRGTEWAAVTRASALPFALIDAVALARLSSAASQTGVQVMAIGVGDPSGVVALGPSSVGASIRPLSPVGLSASASGADLTINWTRRSRDGWRWRDAVDVPIGEENERYRVTKTVSGRPELSIDVLIPKWTYTSAERAADLAAGAATATIVVSQIGAGGISRSASIIVPTN